MYCFDLWVVFLFFGGRVVLLCDFGCFSSRSVFDEGDFYDGKIDCCVCVFYFVCFFVYDVKVFVLML